MRSTSPAYSRFKRALTNRVTSAWGIRQVASAPIPTLGVSDLGLDPSSVGETAARVKRVDYFVPAQGKGAEILQGKREEIVDKLIELVTAKGGLQ